MLLTAVPPAPIMTASMAWPPPAAAAACVPFFASDDSTTMYCSSNSCYTSAMGNILELLDWYLNLYEIGIDPVSLVFLDTEEDIPRSSIDLHYFLEISVHYVCSLL